MARYADYNGLKVIDPAPTVGTPARIIDDNFKTIADGLLNVGGISIIGAFPAPNYESALMHFGKHNGIYWESANRANSDWETSDFGGMFLALANTAMLNTDISGNKSCCGCWCNQSYNNAFSLCVINPQTLTYLQIYLDRFEINTKTIKYLTNLQKLEIGYLTLTDNNLIISGLNNLNSLNLNFTLNNSSLTISNLASLQYLWMDNQNGGMKGINDSNFTLDFNTLPNLQYITLTNNDISLSSATIDNMMNNLENSVVNNPRSGFIVLSGARIAPPTDASASARNTLISAGWGLTFSG